MKNYCVYCKFGQFIGDGNSMKCHLIEHNCILHGNAVIGADGFGFAEGMREKYAPGQKVVYLEKLAEWIELDG